MLKLKKTKKTQITTTVNTYEVTPEILLEEVLTVTKGRKPRSVVSLTPANSKLGKLYGNPELVNKVAFRAYLEQENPFCDHNPLAWETYRAEVTTEALEDPANELVWFYWSGHVLFDVKLQPIPLIEHLGYIGNPVTNQVMSDANLKKFREFCAKRPETVTISEIKPVPYYNNSGGDMFFELRIRPSEKDVKKAFSLVDTKHELWSCRFHEILTGQRRKDFDFLKVNKYLNRDQEAY